MKYVPQVIKRNPFKVLFKNEFSQNIKSLIWWAVIISVLMFSITLIFPLMPDMSLMIDTLPAGVWDALVAMTGGDITSITGYYVMEANQTLLIGGSIFAAILGATLITRDITRGNAEFLYALPAKRKDVWNSKLLVLITDIAIFDFAVAITSLIGLFIFGTSAINVLYYFAYFLLVFILHLEFGVVMFGLASMFKTKANIGITIGLVFILFVVNTISAVISDLDFLKYFSPFAYVNGAVISTGFDVSNWLLWVIAAAVMAISLISGRAAFKKQDLV